MATLTRSVTIDAPADKVFDYALDIRNLFVAPDIALADVSLKPDGVGSSARIWSHFLGFHLEMGLEYTEVVRPQRIVAEVDGFGLDNPVWTFTFEPADGGTKLTAQGEWHIKVPAVGKPIEGLLAREHEDFLDTMLDDVKAGAEGATG
jgi:uncharacterized protein YndB with AHSA1/START domain